MDPLLTNGAIIGQWEAPINQWEILAYGRDQIAHEAGENPLVINQRNTLIYLISLAAETGFEETPEGHSPDAFVGGDDNVEWADSAIDSISW